jgi:hypothetical protein
MENSMSTEQVQLERRVGQRFEYHLPVSIRIVEQNVNVAGCTENLSARGAYVYTEYPLKEGAAVELTLTMPSEITLGEKMRVRCKGRVVRAAIPDGKSKPGIAVHFDNYEYLTGAEDVTTTSSFDRLSALHEHVVS